MRNRGLILVIGLLVALAGCSERATGAESTPVASAAAQSDRPTQAATTALPTGTDTPAATPTSAPTFTPTPAYQSLGLAIPEHLSLAQRLSELDLTASGYQLRVEPSSESDLALMVRGPSDPLPSTAYLFGYRYFAPVVPFDAVVDAVAEAELQERWHGRTPGPLVMDAETAEVFSLVWGQGEPEVVLAEQMLAALQADRAAMGLLPFELLDPTFKVLSVSDLSLFDAALEPSAYPLALALTLEGQQAQAVGPLMAESLGDWPNRDASKLTRLVMTGVTAMCRLTAARMEAYGTTYPAQVIGEELGKADITHVSNEVPFVHGCPVDTSEDNLTFCSDYDYWDALAAIGTDVVGLSGNHVNDFGYDGARESITFYRDRGIPIYGSGLNEAEACAPLFYEHNGNRLAFLAALAYEPSYAWATEDLPGACYFYDNKESILATIRDLAADPEIDMVLVELQYEETYVPYPTESQVAEFRELRDAGADIVTGVQSHVPQAWEPYGLQDEGGPGIIVYGLGNLFFDQMWSWETRTGLIARHTIYDGRLINSEVLTTVLEDYAQPRWATADERAEILARIFGAAPAR